MVSITPCCTSSLRPDRSGRGAWPFARGLGGLGLWALLFALVLLGGMAKAEGVPLESPRVEVERTAEGIHLSARIPFSLPDGVDDVLHKGVPLHFIWQAEVQRPRWYWADQKVASASRVVRLAYQPLTRRWRLSVSSALPSEAGAVNALHQNVDSLQEALAIVTRTSGWKLVDGSMLAPDVTYRVQLRFRLDAGLLPKPFQIGAAGQDEWKLDFTQVLSVPPIADNQP